MANNTDKAAESYTDINQRILSQTCNDCASKRNWKSYDDWHSQRMRIRKGQRSVRIVQLDQDEYEHADGRLDTKESWQTLSLFCQCQVLPFTNGDETQSPVGEQY